MFFVGLTVCWRIVAFFMDYWFLGGLLFLVVDYCFCWIIFLLLRFLFRWLIMVLVMDYWSLMDYLFLSLSVIFFVCGSLAFFVEDCFFSRINVFCCGLLVGGWIVVFWSMFGFITDYWFLLSTLGFFCGLFVFWWINCFWSDNCFFYWIIGCFLDYCFFIDYCFFLMEY